MTLEPRSSDRASGHAPATGARLLRSTLALVTPVGLGGLVAVILIVFAGRYGYHRDELYFLAAGNHLAWGYADQGPLTPLLAHVIDSIAPGSLTALRLPSALMAGATVVVTAATAAELGASGGRKRSPRPAWPPPRCYWSPATCLAPPRSTSSPGRQ